MGTTRKSFSAKFKARIALEALKEVSTINEIGSREGVHPNQIGHWKKQARDGLPDIFSQGNNREKKEASEREASLYQKIGKLKMELEWLKKNSGLICRCKTAYDRILCGHINHTAMRSCRASPKFLLFPARRRNPGES